MGIGAPKELSTLRRFFLQPASPNTANTKPCALIWWRVGPPKRARAFGYSLGSFYVLCHHFRREPEPAFLLSLPQGAQAQPKKSAARDLIIRLRKQNYPV